MNSRLNTKTIHSNLFFLNLLKFFTFCVLIGRAYQGFFFDLPLRTFFWDESLLGDLVVSLTGDSWQNYVTNRIFDLDGFIDATGVGIGVIWGLTALSILWLEKYTRLVRLLLFSSGALLILLSILLWKDNYYALAQLLEQMTQVSMPFLLAIVYQPKKATPPTFELYNTPKFRHALIAIIGFTFCSHGLYAVGYYPTSGAWMEWCHNMLPLSTDESIIDFLWVMGMLDFVAVSLLFFRSTRTIGLSYCIVWGFATALARVLANFYWNMPWVSLHEWTYQTIFRLAHGGLPFLLWLLYQNQFNEHES